jgi:hypothetical protein
VIEFLVQLLDGVADNRLKWNVDMGDLSDEFSEVRRDSISRVITADKRAQRINDRLLKMISRITGDLRTLIVTLGPR